MWLEKNIENTNQPIGKLQCFAAMYFLPLSRNDRTFCDNMGSNEVGPWLKLKFGNFKPQNFENILSVLDFNFTTDLCVVM